MDNKVNGAISSLSSALGFPVYLLQHEVRTALDTRTSLTSSLSTLSPSSNSMVFVAILAVSVAS